MLIIHRDDLASYGWDVVRNSQAVEKSYLEGDPNATLRAAAWIQHDVAQKLFTMAGLGDLDKAIEQRRSSGRISRGGTAGAAEGAHRKPRATVRERERGGASGRARSQAETRFYIPRIMTIWASIRR